MKNILMCLLAAISLVAAPVAAQQLPFTVTLIEWERPAMAEIADLYRIHASEKEMLWCVTSWSRKPLTNGVDQITIHDVELYTVAGRSTIPNVERSCLDLAGRPQPTIHTHSEGNCQPSPWDITTITIRKAAFDGIQCGPIQVVWLNATQYQALTKFAPAY